MNDNDLIIALYKEGVPVAAIAEKFDLRPIDVRHVLGITADPRPLGTWRRFFNVLGTSEYTTEQIVRLMGMRGGAVRSYMARMELRGHARSYLLTKWCRVYRMIDIEREPSA